MRTDRAYRIVVRDIDGLEREFVVSTWHLTADSILEMNNGDDYVMDVAWMKVTEWH